MSIDVRSRIFTEERRKIALQQIVNNSRFLVLAPIKNLASVMLSCTLRELKKDWERQYVLIVTL